MREGVEEGLVEVARRLNLLLSILGAPAQTQEALTLKTNWGVVALIAFATSIGFFWWMIRELALKYGRR